MYRLPAQPSYIPPQPEGPELTEVGRDDRDASLYANLEASAYRPATRPEPRSRSTIPSRPGVKPLIYIEVVPHEDARQGVASRTLPEKKVIYSSVGLDRKAAFKTCAASEAAHVAPGLITEVRVPDEALLVLERAVRTLIEELVRSRPAGPLKPFKSKASYGAQRAMREFGEALDGEGFKKQLRAYERLFPRTANAVEGARRAATEEVAGMAAAYRLHGLSDEERDTLKCHVEHGGGLAALTTMLETDRGNGWRSSTCKGMQWALEDFLTHDA